MKHRQTPYYIQKLKRNYKILRISEALIISLALIVILWTLFYSVFGAPLGVACAIALAEGALLFLLYCKNLRVFKLHEHRITRYLNENFAVLQNSSDLLLMEPETLTTLEQLQQLKIILVFKEVYPSIKLPNKLLQAVSVFALSVVIAVVLL